ncbi:MAG: hypothetical protein C0501_08305 [Isosphaera sp.]|nr:hypothetical protein [Isosphaera sp.]
MKTLSAAALAVLVAAAAGTAAPEDAKKLVGVWELTKSGGDLPVGATVEFTKDGKLNVAVKADGQEMKFDGTYTLKDDKLTVKLKVGDTSIEETATVKKLTDDALEIEDKDKKIDVFKKKK